MPDVSELVESFTTFDPASFAEHQSTVPRKLVHRAAVSEVFLTGAERLGEKLFRCGAQLPRTHSYFNEHAHSTAHYDTLLLLEVFRQASIYITHAFLGVNPQDKFLYMDSATRITRRSALRVGERSAVAVLDIELVDEHYYRGALDGVTLDMIVSIGGQIVARHERMSIRWMNSAAWDRLRARGIATTRGIADERAQHPQPLNAALVARESARNVVLGQEVIEDAGELTAPLIVDQEHAGIFDHPLDHIPGMLLLEGFRQAGLLVAARHHGQRPDNLLLSGCKVAFIRFGEFGLKTHVRADLDTLRRTPEGGLAVTLLADQNGAIIATAEIELLPISYPHQQTAANDNLFAAEVV